MKVENVSAVYRNQQKVCSSNIASSSKRLSCFFFVLSRRRRRFSSCLEIVRNSQTLKAALLSCFVHAEDLQIDQIQNIIDFCT